MLLTSKELREATGITDRQIWYWKGYLIHPIPQTNVGSGFGHRWDSSIVPMVRLLVKLSNDLSRNVSIETLKKIVDNYNKGRVQIVDGVWLMWKLEEAPNGVTGSSEGSPPTTG